jgi:hypothetical protein
MQDNRIFAETCALDSVEKIRALDIREYGSIVIKRILLFSGNVSI